MGAPGRGPPARRVGAPGRGPDRRGGRAGRRARDVDGTSGSRPTVGSRSPRRAPPRRRRARAPVDRCRARRRRRPAGRATGTPPRTCGRGRATARRSWSPPTTTATCRSIASTPPPARSCASPPPPRPARTASCARSPTGASRACATGSPTRPSRSCATSRPAPPRACAPRCAGFTEADGDALRDRRVPAHPWRRRHADAWFLIPPARRRRARRRAAVDPRRADGAVRRRLALALEPARAAAAPATRSRCPTRAARPGAGRPSSTVWGNAWGGACYRDLMAVTDGRARPDVDAARMAAMGGSFGGYMANWIGAQTDRFRALVTHAGLVRLPAFHGATDYPAWFAPSWRARPSRRSGALAAATRTRTSRAGRRPTLILHGEKDYPCRSPRR